MPAAKLTAVLGNCKRVGRWKIRSTTKALVVFGNCSIDYTDAYADADLEEIKLDVLCLFGRAVFTLPEGASVQPSSVNMLSSSKFDVEQTDTPSDLPIIKMQTTTVFGFCRVQTGSEDLLDLDAPSVDEQPEDLAPPRSSVTMSEPDPSAPDPVMTRQAQPLAAPAPLVPPTPPPLNLPAEPLTTIPPMPEPVERERAASDVDEGEPGDPERPRLSDLDPAKAITIDDDTDTVHIAA